MTKSALFAVAGFLGFCLPVSAQQVDRPEQAEIFSLQSAVAVKEPLSAFGRPDNFNALNSSFRGLPALTFSNERLFSLSTGYNWMEPNFLPALSAVETPSSVTPARVSASESSDELLGLRPFFDYAGGEVGFLYGRSSGKYGREDTAAYIIGEMGNDKFHITVGAAHWESSGRVPRRGR